MPYLKVKPLGPVARAADRLMHPVMRILMELNGTPEEHPQLTHRWNNKRLGFKELSQFNQDLLRWYLGNPKARRLISFLIHLPWIGWQYYLVIEPVNPGVKSWYPGVVLDSGGIIFRVPAKGPIRLLRGRASIAPSGVDLEGRQIAVQVIGYGKLGDKKHSSVPLY